MAKKDKAQQKQQYIREPFFNSWQKATLFPVAAVAAAGAIYGMGAHYEDEGAKNLQAATAEQTFINSQANKTQLKSDYFTNCEAAKKTKLDKETGIGETVYACAVKIDAKAVSASAEGLSATYKVTNAYDTAPALREVTRKVSAANVAVEKKIEEANAEIVKGEDWQHNGVMLSLGFGILAAGLTIVGSGLSYASSKKVYVQNDRAPVVA